MIASSPALYAVSISSRVNILFTLYTRFSHGFQGLFGSLSSYLRLMLDALKSFLTGYGEVTYKSLMRN